jgi:hypothetical protein
MAIVLTLRFICEMAALAAVAYWGQQAADGAAGVALAAIAVAVVAVVWGTFLAPRRRLAVGLPARLVIELVVWTAAAAALWTAGHPALAVVLFLVAAVTGAINANTAAKTAPG